MTVKQYIEAADAIKVNAYDTDTKLQWFNNCEQNIFLNIIKQHVQADESAEMPLYTTSNYNTAVPLVAEPFAYDLYLDYLFMMIDSANQEWGQYNVSLQRFNEAREEYAAWYTRTNMPKNKGDFRI